MKTMNERRRAAYMASGIPALRKKAYDLSYNEPSRRLYQNTPEEDEMDKVAAWSVRTIDAKIDAMKAARMTVRKRLGIEDKNSATTDIYEIAGGTMTHKKIVATAPDELNALGLAMEWARRWPNYQWIVLEDNRPIWWYSNHRAAWAR